MTRTRFILCLFGAAILCGGVFFCVSDATVVPMVSRGTGPGGIQVTTGGWAAFVLSLLGTCGFSLSGLAVWIASHFQLGSQSPVKATRPIPDPVVGEVVELTESFAALLKDQGQRAAQRRFVFALVDAASLLQGCQASHENGVIVIRYSGYADPPAADILKA